MCVVVYENERLGKIFHIFSICTEKFEAQKFYKAKILHKFLGAKSLHTNFQAEKFRRKKFSGQKLYAKKFFVLKITIFGPKNLHKNFQTKYFQTSVIFPSSNNAVVGQTGKLWYRLCIFQSNGMEDLLASLGKAYHCVAKSQEKPSG